MKFFTLSFLSLLHLTVLAGEIPCVEKLTRNGTEKSSHFYLRADIYKWTNDYNELNPNVAQEALNFFLRHRVHCELDEVTITKEILCNEIVPGNKISRQCFFETNLGYFTLSKDGFNSFHIIFFLWPGIEA